MHAKTPTTPGTGKAASQERGASSAVVRTSLRLLGAGPVVILLALIVLLSFLSPYFLTGRNLSNILSQTAVIALVAMGQHIVILTRGIDLSVGSNLALASVVGALVFKSTDSTFLVVVAMIASGGLVGAINGLVYVYGRLPHPFIITLATLSIAKGTALELSDGRAIQGMPDFVRAIGGGSIYGIPGSLFVVAGVALLFAVMAKTMVWGRWIYAVGGKPEAAVQMGIPVKRVLISAYVISGLCAGLGAILLAGRTDAGSPLFGNLLELDTIAAVIIGGASFLGGRGHIGHALVGAIMIGVIRNALNLLNVDIFFQLIVIGVVIVMAVEADVLRNHLEGRMRVLQAAGQA
ncbi:MAG: ABC transporter permease [Hoeflea sp.]|nr:ABC transporter permease [Alphaproteobacteria bacterium]MBU4546404.1 ABC transporter permease [Alphaproteobacteria bacterium]MBU4549533.1 ABC transporter permease [Alphaproteobacteria bacterium]MBV1722708.1 ABC transporter permease [Hoeflea sp.]MBV1782647.1 ABC transporter permease [Hoeflea sp.]